MFQALLKDVVDGTQGAVSSVVMDLDGIALETYSSPDAPFDVKTVGIELSVVLKGVRHAAEMLGAGEAHEMAIVSDGLTTVARLITSNYFIALSLQPGGNLGKARYLMRVRAPELAAELI